MPATPAPATSSAALRAALLDVPPVAVGSVPDLGRAVFVGSGDSLASGLIATGFGHRALSAGDVAWSETLPAACDTLVGISHSGTSGATVRALRMARTAGLKTVAITSQASSPLADSADEVQLVPVLRVEEVVPCAGHVMLAQGVAAVCGVDTSPFNPALAKSLDRVRVTVDAQVRALPESAPAAVSVLSLPELCSGADFWVLKLIEACGLAVRNVPLEESGHVDYFIGPEQHLTLQLMGPHGRPRFDRLAEALLTTGQTVVQVDTSGLTDSDLPDAAVLHDIATAVAGAWFAQGAALRWGRPPFRGGAVNMDAQHIKLDS
ncbi:SIS domain-containing protein [Streptomyces sp. NBC_00038]|uniref:SIS domain-containing protein n=1 Tax=Streptomyces sp. NBC_00038 TaxID=2903615 RepID=UPI0022589B40|nr:SIS domain-containing protein [Streptomyces sp. NBC_00038]MCX5554465.1 SIS domain-containing protein [Streptomyces sp. NBC_00038]